MIWILISFAAGLVLSYGHRKLFPSQDEIASPEYAINPKFSTESIPQTTLDYDGICDALEETTGDLWYYEDAEQRWTLGGISEDGEKSYHIMSIPSDDFNYRPNQANADFIVKSKNEYIPQLLAEIDRLDQKNEIIQIFIQSSIDNVKYTKEEYKMILQQTLAMLQG